MIVYEVHWDNNESYGDNHHYVDNIFISRELAEEYISIKNNKPKDEYYNSSYSIIEHEVLTALPQDI